MAAGRADAGVVAIVATAANSNDGRSALVNSRLNRISPCHTTALQSNQIDIPLRWWLQSSARAVLWSRRRRRGPFGRAGRPLVGTVVECVCANGARGGALRSRSLPLQSLKPAGRSPSADASSSDRPDPARAPQSQAAQATGRRRPPTACRPPDQRPPSYRRLAERAVRIDLQ